MESQICLSACYIHTLAKKTYIPFLANGLSVLKSIEYEYEAHTNVLMCVRVCETECVYGHCWSTQNPHAVNVNATLPSIIILVIAALVISPGRRTETEGQTD